jgi:hypothetical protein
MGVGLVCVVAVARDLRWRDFDRGERILLAHLAALAVFYTFRFGAPFFRVRYFAPLVLATVPVLATSFEARLGARPALQIGIVAVVLGLNLPSFLAGVERCPPWLARVLPVRHHVNENYESSAVYALSRVRPECRVAAANSGTLGYFRDRVTDLSGKVNPLARGARASLFADPSSTSSEEPIDVVVDLTPCIDGLLRGRPSRFEPAERYGDAEAWVRRGRASCLLPLGPTGAGVVDSALRAAEEDHGGGRGR